MSPRSCWTLFPNLLARLETTMRTAIAKSSDAVHARDLMRLGAPSRSGWIGVGVVVPTLPTFDTHIPETPTRETSYSDFPGTRPGKSAKSADLMTLTIARCRAQPWRVESGNGTMGTHRGDSSASGTDVPFSQLSSILQNPDGERWCGWQRLNGRSAMNGDRPANLASRMPAGCRFKREPRFGSGHHGGLTCLGNVRPWLPRPARSDPCLAVG